MRSYFNTFPCKRCIQAFGHPSCVRITTKKYNIVRINTYGSPPLPPFWEYICPFNKFNLSYQIFFRTNCYIEHHFYSRLPFLLLRNPFPYRNLCNPAVSKSDQGLSNHQFGCYILVTDFSVNYKSLSTIFFIQPLT